MNPYAWLGPCNFIFDKAQRSSRTSKMPRLLFRSAGAIASSDDLKPCFYDGERLKACKENQ